MRAVRKALSRLFRIVLVAGLLAVGTVSAIAFTRLGTRLCVEMFLEKYNAIIPGEIRVKAIDGSLLGGFELRGVELLDRFRNPLIKADRLLCDMDAWNLLSGVLHARVLEVKTADVTIRAYRGKSSFIDLAPFGVDSGSKSDEPMGELILPLSIVVDELNVSDARLYTLVDGKTAALVEVDRLSLNGSWSGGDARFVIHETGTRLPGQNLTLGSFKGTAILKKGRYAALENASAETDWGYVRFDQTDFHIDTKSGGVRLDLTSHTDRLKSFVSWPTSQKLHAEIRAGIHRGQALTAALTISIADAAIDFSASSTLAELPNVDASYELKNLTPSLFGAPFEGRLDGRGTVAVETPPEGSPRVTFEFASTHAGINPFGALDLCLTASLDRLGIQTNLYATGRNAGFAASASLNEHREATARWRGRVGDPAPFKNWIPLKQLKGVATTEGGCSGRASSLFCRYRAVGEKLQARDLSVASIRSGGRIGVNGGAFFIDGKTSIKNIRVGGLRLQSVETDFDPIPNGFAATIAAVERPGSSFFLRAAATMTQPMIVDISKLESTLEGAAIRLLKPLQIALTKNSVALGPGGASFAFDKGTVIVTGRVSEKRLHNVTIRVDDFDLHSLARFIAPRQLEGQARLVLKADGPLARPSVTLDGSVRELSVQNSPAYIARVFATLRNKEASFEASLNGVDASRISVDGSAPVNIDLKAFRFSLPKNAPAQVRWMLHGISSHELAQYMPLPVGLDFEASGRGILRFSSLADFRLEGTLEGSGSSLQTGEVDSNLQFDLTLHSQHLSLDVKTSGLSPLHAEVDAKVLLDKALDGYLEVNESVAELTVGNASLNADLEFLRGKDGRGQIRFRNFDTALAGAFLKNFKVEGTLTGNASFALEGGQSDMLLEVSADRSVVEGIHLGAWTLSARVKNTGIWAEGALLQQNREVASFSVSIPMKIDPETLTIERDPDRTHRLSFRADMLDLAVVLPTTAFKGVRSLEISGRGSFIGALAAMNGVSSLHAVLRHKSLGEIPMDIGLQTLNERHRLAFSIFKGRPSQAVLSAETRVAPEKLLGGKIDFKNIPVSARFEMKRFDLSRLSVFDLSPVYDLSGTAACAVSLRGTLAEPSLSGTLKIASGGLSLVKLEDSLSDIDAFVSFSESGFQLKNLSFKSGKGNFAAAANGNFSNQGDLYVRAAATSRELRIAMSGMPVFLLDTDASVDFRSDKTMRDARIVLNRSVIKHVVENRGNIRKVRLNENVRLIESRAKTEKVPLEKEEQSTAEPFRFSVKTGKPLRVAGAALDTSWKVNLSGESKNGALHLDGNAALEKGSFDLFSNPFVVEEAAATFSEKSGLDPHIRLSASTKLPDADVFVRVDGTVSDPRMQLYSEPSMSQEAILTMLLSGSSDKNVSGSSVIGNLISMKYPVAANVLQNKLGFDRISIGGNGSGTGTTVKLGSRINEKLFLYTSFNLHAEDNENDYDVHFEYDIVDQVTLDTIAGNQTSSVELNWRVPINRKKKKSAH